MNLKQLEYFLKVAEFGSFSRAAEALHLEQSALSKQVRLLEVELRQTLFMRTGRGVVPTAAGTVVLEHGRGILHQVVSLREALELIRGALAGRVAFGMVPSIARVIAAPLILEVRKSLPQVTVAISEAMAQSLQESIANGSLDAAFVYNASPSPDILTTLLLEEELFLVQLKSAMAGRRRAAVVALEELAKLPLVISTRPNTLRLLVETELAMQGVKPVIAFEVDGSPTILDLVAHGAGVTLLPRRVVENSAHAARFVLRRVAHPPLRSSLSVIMSARRALTLTQQKVLDIAMPLARRLLA